MTNSSSFMQSPTKDQIQNTQDWSCKSCGFSNFKNRTTCKNCNAQMTQKVSFGNTSFKSQDTNSFNVQNDSFSQKSDWNCRNCEFTNFKNRTTCKNCNSGMKPLR